MERAEGVLKRRGEARDIAAIPIQINANGPRCQGQKKEDSAHIFSPPCGCNDEHLRHAILRNRETERADSFRLHEVAPRKISFLVRILHNAAQSRGEKRNKRTLNCVQRQPKKFPKNRYIQIYTYKVISLRFADCFDIYLRGYSIVRKSHWRYP